MGTSRRIDWPTARREYVEGIAIDPDGDPSQRTWPSIDEIAVRHGTSTGHTRVRAAKEHWTDLRAAHQAEADRERQRRLVEQRADKAVELDSRALTLTDAGLSHIGIRLTYLTVREAEKPAGERGRDLDAGELAALGLAARRWLQVKAQVMGQPIQAAESVDQLERDFLVAEAAAASRLAEHIAAAVQARTEQSEEVEA